MIHRRLVVALLLLVSFVAGCSPTSSTSTKQVLVVTTSLPMFDAVTALAGPYVHAVNLLPLDPFGPVSVAKQKQLTEADLVVSLGKGTQPQVDSALKNRTKETIDALDLVRAKPRSADPYFWLNPMQMNPVANRVSGELQKLVPAHAKDIRKKTVKYNKSLALLDLNLSKGLAKCDRREIYVVHPEFQYLADRYHLQQVQVAVPSYSAFDSIGDQMKATGATTLFDTALPPISEARDVYKRHGIRIAVLDPAISQSDQARRGGASYLSILGLDLSALKAALGCTDLTKANK